jgi:hypothetical protein
MFYFRIYLPSTGIGQRPGTAEGSLGSRSRPIRTAAGYRVVERGEQVLF